MGGDSKPASRVRATSFCAGATWAGGLVAAAMSCSGLALQLPASDLVELTLEQLANIEVTSVSRRVERLSRAAASIYVITSEDIRRSGATSLPEALRLAPNLNVARADNVQYSITARGFNGVLANKLLVLIDGRTVYSPLFSGVFWEAQDVLLEDVERIEVISGPGGTLWGSNAVNGVINVITRAAAGTQGALAAAGGGNKEHAGAARYGGTVGGGHYRVYGKYVDRTQTRRADGTGLRDEMERAQAGFRTDWAAGANSFTVQGDAYTANIQQGLADREISGANVLGRWARELGSDSRMHVLAYFDHSERDQPGAIRNKLDTFELDFQHALAPAQGHRILWGGGFRHQRDRVENISRALAFLPPERNLNLVNVFVQDEFQLREHLELTAGLKLEHNSYTGLEYLPNVRLAWNPAPNQLVWGALSRAVRAPSRIDRDFFAPANPPFSLVAGGDVFQSEISRVAEIGYRAQPSAVFSYSATLFHHRFDRLRSLESTAAAPVFANKINGRTTGIEAWGSFQVIDAWRLSAGGVRQSIKLQRDPDSRDIGGLAALGNDPRYWWTLRSSFDLAPQLDFDVFVRHVGALPSPSVPAYTAVDARIGWRLRRDLELSLTAHNLFDRGHAEWGASAARPEFERSIYAKLLWRM